jgi:hypothetical protein
MPCRIKENNGFDRPHPTAEKILFDSFCPLFLLVYALLFYLNLISYFFRSFCHLLSFILLLNPGLPNTLMQLEH